MNVCTVYSSVNVKQCDHGEMATNSL